MYPLGARVLDPWLSKGARVRVSPPHRSLVYMPSTPHLV